MKLLICIDDTDNLESRGTGSIASEIKSIIKDEYKNTSVSYVSRHQLLLHRDIRYTSHNSSMAFECVIQEDDYGKIVKRITEYVKNESAKGSDPGIAVLKIDDINELEKIDIINYGFKTKRIVLDKDSAYRTAEKYKIYLKELGGDGSGIIGALAGIGLRLSKNDGEVKGHVKDFKKGKTYKIKDLLDNRQIDEVISLRGDKPRPEDPVKIPWRVKQVIKNGRRVVLVKEEDDMWITMVKKDLRVIDKEKSKFDTCTDYLVDVSEELLDIHDSCLNCRYRRWKEMNFECMKGKMI